MKRTIMLTIALLITATIVTAQSQNKNIEQEFMRLIGFPFHLPRSELNRDQRRLGGSRPVKIVAYQSVRRSQSPPH
jgi:hypothetical protein